MTAEGNVLTCDTCHTPLALTVDDGPGGLTSSYTPEERVRGMAKAQGWEIETGPDGRSDYCPEHGSNPAHPDGYYCLGEPGAPLKSKALQPGPIGPPQRATKQVHAVLVRQGEPSTGPEEGLVKAACGRSFGRGYMLGRTWQEQLGMSTSPRYLRGVARCEECAAAVARQTRPPK